MRPGLGGLEAPVVGEGVVEDEELEAGDVHLVDLSEKGGGKFKFIYGTILVRVHALFTVQYIVGNNFFFVWRFSGSQESIFRRV